MPGLEVLLEKIQSKLTDVRSSKFEMGIQDRQVLFIESNLQLIGYEPNLPDLFGVSLLDNGLESGHMRPVYDVMHGKIGNTDLDVGGFTFWVNRPGEPNLSAVLLRYVNQPFIMNGPNSYPEEYNKGIANIFLFEDGTIYPTVQMPNAPAPTILTPWVTGDTNIVGIKYPKESFNPMEALDVIRRSSFGINMLIPFSQKIALLSLVAADAYRGIDETYTSYLNAEKELQVLGGKIAEYNITEKGIPPELSSYFQKKTGEHPLEGLVQNNLIPENISVILVEDYEGMIITLAEGGFPFPVIFRDIHRGLYVSEKSPWQDSGSVVGFKELLAYRDINFESAIIMPMKYPEAEKEWETPWSFLQHQALLNAIEQMPDRMSILHEFAEETGARWQAKDLLNAGFSFVNIPDKDDKSSPYRFFKYGTEEQNRLLAAFCAGIMTINRPVNRYWFGKQLHGDGKNMWHYFPEGIHKAMIETGFLVENAPQREILPVYQREVGYDDISTMLWPTADLAYIWSGMESKLWVLGNPLTLNHLPREVEVNGARFDLNYNYHNCDNGIEFELDVKEGNQHIANGKVTFFSPWSTDFDPDKPDLEPREFRYGMISEMEVNKNNPSLKQALTNFFWQTIVGQLEYLGIEKLAANPSDSTFHELGKEIGFTPYDGRLPIDARATLVYNR